MSKVTSDGCRVTSDDRRVTTLAAASTPSAESMKSTSSTTAVPGWRAPLLLAAAVFAAADAQAALVRGPYLQWGTPASVKVRWRTDDITDSRVRYGLSAAALSSTVDDATPTTEHEVTLTGLSPDTLYFYSIGSTTTTLAGGDADHRFITAPPVGTTKDVHFWVIGDAGTKNANQAAVRDAFRAYDAGRRLDLWLMLGDNAYLFGSDTDYQAAVFDVYQQELRTTALWSTLGNHETYSTEGMPPVHAYYNIFSLPTDDSAGGVASGTEAYYAFDYANIHFICLDSMQSDRSPMGAMATWLDSDLQAAVMRADPPDWIVVFFHHPPYSKGSHDSDNGMNNMSGYDVELVQMRENLLPILENYGVDLVLSGHSHSYERSMLIDGHYGFSTTFNPMTMAVDPGDGRADGDGAYTKPTLGPAAHEGTVYNVVGSSGLTQAGGSLNHPVMIQSLLTLGSLLVDVDRNTLHAKFLDSAGTIQDYFTIVKGGATPPLDLCPSAPRANCRTAGKAILISKDATPDDKDKLTFKWQQGTAAAADLGSPTTTTDYGLCIYAGGALASATHVGAGTGWTAPAAGGFQYQEDTGSADGIRKIVMKPDAGGYAKILWKGKGTNLPALPATPAALPVVAQLVNSETGVCFDASFPTAVKNEGGKFKAKY